MHGHNRAVTIDAYFIITYYLFKYITLYIVIIRITWWVKHFLHIYKKLYLIHFVQTNDA